MGSGAPVLDSGRLPVSRLLRRRVRLEFRRVDDPGAHLERVRETTGGRSVGVYVHVPFCRSVCTFCPYFREVLRDRAELERYLRALLREVEVYGRALEGLGLRVVEIHVGGGTPSLVPPRAYGELVEALSEFFDVECGVGIEANPEDLGDLRLAEELRSAGVDEVSVGVQSFDPRVLKALGRKHSPEDGARALENSLRAGFEWVNADIMFLAPTLRGYAEMTLEEKLKAFRGDLERCYELGVHQVTFYPTVVPRHSPGYRLVELGRVSQELEALDSFVEEALGFSESRGLHLVRVYSASRRRYEYATVNLEMVGPLIGLGAGAWGNTGLYQYVNVHDVAAYASALGRGLPPALYSREMSRSSRAWRVLFDQLSAVEVREEAFRAAGLGGIPLGARLYLKALELAGVVERVGRVHRLTRRGVAEVYKAVVNYVVEVPVRATELFTRASRPGGYPEVVELS